MEALSFFAGFCGFILAIAAIVRVLLGINKVYPDALASKKYKLTTRGLILAMCIIMLISAVSGALTQSPPSYNNIMLIAWLILTPLNLLFFRFEYKEYKKLQNFEELEVEVNQ